MLYIEWLDFVLGADYQVDFKVQSPCTIEHMGNRKSAYIGVGLAVAGGYLHSW